MNEEQLEQVPPTLAPDAVLNDLLENPDQAQQKLVELNREYDTDHPFT